MTRARAVCEACGFDRTYRSEPIAAHALSRHSCHREQTRRDAARRRAERTAAVDRTPRPCLHPRARHRHGTRAAYYADRCRCQPCARANSAYEKQRTRLHAYGRWTHWADPGPARNHVRSLMAAGIGWKRVARLAGVPPSTVTQLLYGKRRRDGEIRPLTRIRRPTAQALLAVTRQQADTAAATQSPRVRVDPTGARRRLQALVALGWPQTTLARRAGMTPTQVGRLVHGHAGVSAARHATIGRVYDELGMTPGPSRTAAAQAARAGWAPPLAWDDDTLDDPAAAPQGAGYTRPRFGTLRRLPDDPAELAAQVNRDGLPGVAARHRVTPAAVQAALTRAGYRARRVHGDYLRHKASA